MYTIYNDIYIFILDLTFLIHLPVPLPVHQKNRYGIHTYKTHIFYTYYTPSFLPAPIFGSSFSWRDLTKWPNFSTPRVFSTVFMSLILAIERRQFSPDNIPVCLVFKFFKIIFCCHFVPLVSSIKNHTPWILPAAPRPFKKKIPFKVRLVKSWNMRMVWCICWIGLVIFILFHFVWWQMSAYTTNLHILHMKRKKKKNRLSFCFCYFSLSSPLCYKSNSHHNYVLRSLLQKMFVFVLFIFFFVTKPEVI